MRTGRLKQSTAKHKWADHTRMNYAGDSFRGVYQIVNETQYFVHQDCAIDIGLDAPTLFQMGLENS